MKRIGEGSNILLVVSFLAFSLLISLLFFVVDIALGCITLFVTLAFSYFQSKLRQIDLDRDAIVVTNLLWRKTRISIHDVISINQIIYPIYSIELKNDKNIHFRLPLNKSFPYNISLNIEEEKTDHLDQVLDKINKLKLIYPEVKNRE